MAKIAELRDLSLDELRSKEKDLDDQLFRLRIQKSMGQLDEPLEGARRPSRSRAGEDVAAREEGVAQGIEQ